MQLTPKTAFFNVLIFVTISLLLLMGRMQLQVSLGRLQGRTRGQNAKGFSERMLQFIWKGVEERLEDKLHQRATLWEASLNKSRSTTRSKRFPDVVIVGAEHCGAEALTRLLMLHPLVKPARNIDTKFFTAHFAKGASYYMEEMPWASPGDIVLESSSMYFSWPPMVTPKRIKDMMPKAKVLIALCNPVDRAHVDYQNELKAGRLPEDSKYEITLGTYLPKFGAAKWSKYKAWDGTAQTYITDMFRKEYASHIITSGLYYYHMLRWTADFDHEHLKVINRDDLLENPGQEVEDLQRFLGIPQLMLKEDFVFHNKSQSHCFQPTWPSRTETSDLRCPLRLEVKKRSNQSYTCAQSLKKFYAPFNKKLYQKLGRDFGW